MPWLRSALLEMFHKFAKYETFTLRLGMTNKIQHKLLLSCHSLVSTSKFTFILDMEYFSLRISLVDNSFALQRVQTEVMFLSFLAHVTFSSRHTLHLSLSVPEEGQAFLSDSSLMTKIPTQKLTNIVFLHRKEKFVIVFVRTRSERGGNVNVCVCLCVKIACCTAWHCGIAASLS